MAYGDVGGAATTLSVTCRTLESGVVKIRKGDAVSLAGSGGYTVTNDQYQGFGPLIGQALFDADSNGETIPIKLRGICVFRYVGQAPIVDGKSGVWMSPTNGAVMRPGHSVKGQGLNLKVDEAASVVHVLL